MEARADTPRRPFTVKDVERMIAAGVLGEDDRVELIEGELLLMSPRDPLHASVVQRLTGRLVRAYGPDVRVRVQLPFVASDLSMPEPDFAVVGGDDRAFEDRHPGGLDAELVVEVSWSSADRDRRKADIYGRAGVPVYWRLDIEQRRLEVHRRPAADGTYTLVEVLDESQEVDVPGTAQTWRVLDLLPSA